MVNTPTPTVKLPATTIELPNGYKATVTSNGTVMLPGGNEVPLSAFNLSDSQPSPEEYVSSDSYSDSSNSYTESSSSTSPSKPVERIPIKVSDDAPTTSFEKPSHEGNNKSFDFAKPNTNGGSISRPAITGIGSRELIANIDVNKANLEVNAKKIKQAASKLEEIWNDIKTNQINTINNSWVGSAAEEYTSKILRMEPKINAVKEALLLISKNYDAAINEINSKQSELKSKIQSM